MKYFTILLILLTSFSFKAYPENTVSSTVVTNSTPPTANAPSVINSNSDICKVGVGSSVQNNVLGFATGYVIDDELCQKLKLSRSLYSYGMKVAAVSLLCQDPRVWTSMADAGTPCPVDGLIGAESQEYWKNNIDKIPEGSRYKEEYLVVKQSETKELTDAQNAVIYKAMLVVLTGIIIF